MNVLGINGWLERSHDASACLVRNGDLIAYVEEERLTRQKYSFDRLPLNAIAYCLKVANLSPDEVDLVAWGWELPRLYELHGRKFSYSEQDLNDLLFPKKYYPAKKRIIPIMFVNHHLAHAASVYCLRSDDNPMAIVVLDGSGENDSVSIYHGQEGTLKMMQNFPVLASPGFFYGAACQYLGFTRQQAGKLMGLASYGQPDGSFFFQTFGSEITDSLSITLRQNGTLDWEEEIITNWLEIFRKKWGEIVSPQCSFSALKGRMEPFLVLNEREKNIAATIQSELEKVYRFYIQRALELVPANQIGLAGGVALNCSANGMIMEKRIVEQAIIPPTANDAGVALGAAAVALGRIPRKLFSNPYLGPDFSVNEIRQCLLTSKIDFSEPADLNMELAKSLDQGKIIGYFQGRMEIGPRALGARSILADPRKEENNPLVNRIKSRELWRPLAPSIMEGESGTYFLQSRESPYMLMRNLVKKDQISIIPAVVHVDESARPQTVYCDTNPSFYNLLSKFQSLAGIPIVLNTSFNNEKEPIVCTPLDALRTFYETGLDELAIGPFLVKKRS